MTHIHTDTHTRTEKVNKNKTECDQKHYLNELNTKEQIRT